MSNADISAILLSLGVAGKKALDSLPLLRNNYEIARSQTETLNPDRRLNLAYYVGQQWCEYDYTLGAIVPSANSRRQSIPPITDNVLGPLADTLVANISNQPPKMEVVATTSDTADLAEANLANHAAEAFWHKLSLSDFYQMGHLEAIIMFNCFQEYMFDFNSGRRVPIMTGDGVQLISEGDIVIKNIPPTRVFVDPLAERVMPERTRPTDARWLFVEEVVDIGEILNNTLWKRGPAVIKSTAGNDIVLGGIPQIDQIVSAKAALPTDDEIAMSGKLGLDMQKAVQGGSTFQEKGKSEKVGKMVRRIRYYEHMDGNPNFPRGRMAVFLPDNDWHLLEYREEMPYATTEHPDGLFPFTMIVDTPVPGRLAGRSRMADARPLQDEINREMTHWRTLRETFRPVILVDEDAGMTARQMANANRLVDVFAYRSTIGGQPPAFLWPSGIQLEMQTAINTLISLTHRCEDKMGIHSVAYHPHKEGTTLGEIEMMRLEDLSRQENNDIKRAEEVVYAPGVKLILRLAQRYYSEDRLIAFFGDKNKGMVRKFRGSDLHFQDVMIVPGTTMRKSRALQVALWLRAAEVGALNSPDPGRQQENQLNFLNALNLGITVESTDDQLDSNNADAENETILDGIEPPVEYFDNHVIHAARVVRLFKSAKFRNLPAVRKEAARRAGMAHYQMHNMMLSKDLQQSPAIMGIAAGAQQEQETGTTPMGTAIPAGNGRIYVPQEMPGRGKNAQLFGRGAETEVPADTGEINAAEVPSELPAAPIAQKQEG